LTNTYNADDPDNNFQYGRGGPKYTGWWFNCGSGCNGQNGLVVITTLSASGCTIGTYLEGDSCVDCSPGTYSDKVGFQTFCTQCDAGKISTSSRSSTCESCMAGTWATQGASVCNR
jgi:hypothetical protein